MTALVLATLAGAGTYLLVSPGPNGDVRAGRRARLRARIDAWLSQAGLAGVRPRDVAAASTLLGLVAAAATFAVLAAPAPALVAGLAAAVSPLATLRARRRLAREKAQEAWPRMIDEIRVLTCSLGRSIPQALFEVGQRAPAELRPAFDAAHREWLLSTDFARTLAVLKSLLADATADAAAETLLVAHELGGTGLERRLAALAEDRSRETEDRKDARARLAGARFARRFVLVVPAGMALAGMAIGSGREAFAGPGGQFVAVVAVTMVVACWWWAGSLLRVPSSERVFDR